MKGFRFVIACGCGTVLRVWRWGWGEEICACSTAHQRSGKVIFFCVCVMCSTWLPSLQQGQWFRGHGLHDVHCLWPFTTAAVNVAGRVVVLFWWWDLILICLSYTWHYSYAFIVNDAFIFYFFSLQLCVFSIWRSSPGPLCSCYYPPLTPRGPRELFSLGYTDKLSLPDWLTTLSVARRSHNAPWLPSNDYRQFFSPLSLHVCLHIHTRSNTQTNNMTSSYKAMNLRWVQLEEKATNPA